MKLKLFICALLPLSLMACQSYEVNNVRDHATQLFQKQNPSKVLSTYTWSSHTGAEKPLQLQFDRSGSLFVTTSCNNLAGSWSVDSDQITTSPMRSTLMACTNNAMQQERLAADLLQNRAVPFILDMAKPQQPQLTLISPNGKRYIFQGKLTPEAQYQSAGETIFLEINPVTRDCQGMMPQRCLQVREVKYNAQGLETYRDAQWKLFYQPITGYQHNPNERQVIRVKRYEIKNPAADQSRYAYVHDMTIERETVR